MLGCITPALAASSSIHAAVDWTTSLRNVSTAATIEVDVMPHLGRTPEGGSFTGYYTALSNLGAAYVRFAPWVGYPRVVVAELEKADCSGRGSSWNTTLLDQVVSDFMTAVCGPRAADGECDGGLSVVPQLSTMPAWMYEDDGTDHTPLEDPWEYPDKGMDYYVVHRQPLRDPSCREMARYAARYVGWYTMGGMTDECGVRHESALRYKWPLLSVLNEDEYNTAPEGGVQYTVCWDAWREEIAKVNPQIKLVGPEIAGGPHGIREARPPSSLAAHSSLGSQLDYTLYFLNGSHHADGQPPPFVSLHLALSGAAAAAHTEPARPPRAPVACPERRLARASQVRRTISSPASTHGAPRWPRRSRARGSRWLRARSSS